MGTRKEGLPPARGLGRGEGVTGLWTGIARYQALVTTAVFSMTEADS